MYSRDDDENRQFVEGWLQSEITGCQVDDIFAYASDAAVERFAEHIRASEIQYPTGEMNDEAFSRATLSECVDVLSEERLRYRRDELIAMEHSLQAAFTDAAVDYPDEDDEELALEQHHEECLQACIRAFYDHVEGKGVLTEAIDGEARAKIEGEIRQWAEDSRESTWASLASVKAAEEFFTWLDRQEADVYRPDTAFREDWWLGGNAEPVEELDDELTFARPRDEEVSTGFGM